MEVDYKNILIEYIATVVYCEGISYVADCSNLSKIEYQKLLEAEKAANSLLEQEKRKYLARVTEFDGEEIIGHRG